MRKQKLFSGRKIQKRLIETTGSVVDLTSEASAAVGKKIGEFDRQHGVTEKIRLSGGLIGEAVTSMDKKVGVSKAASKTKDAIASAGRRVGETADKIAEHVGAYKAAESVENAAKKIADQYQLQKHLREIGKKVETVYGSTRSFIKPYFLPETPDQLLRNAKSELAYTSACIMQISSDDAEKVAAQFGKVVTSKIAGVAATGALLSLVSTFGTAGTGTAIASLSGAASSSATLAWVGGLLGGGMATGAVLTGGVGLIVGLGAYKALSSERRDFESLEEIEQRVLQYCWMLIAIIDEHLQGDCAKFNAGQARTLLHDTLLPLQEMLKSNSDAICNNLDAKNAAAFRQHVLKDFGPTVIEPFRVFVEDELVRKTLRYEYVIGGVIYALLTRSAVDSTIEDQLVLVALRRSDPDLANASESDISNYLVGYDEKQLKGIANNVKGIYHELMWVEQYNATHTDTRAELYEATNYPGADVRLVDKKTGEAIAEYQLKATDSVDYVEEHQMRYTEVEVIATDEVANRMEDVEASNNLNSELTANTEGSIDELADNTLGDRTLEGAGLAATVATGQELVEMLQGKKEFPDAVKETIKKSGTAGVATAIAAYLFS